jgi:Arc/MetJ-type ribon-helix-helix transcriptional regulator
MTITLSPEHEQVIRQAIQAGRIERADEVVDFGLDALRSRLESRGASATAMTAEQWTRELHEWITSHSPTTPLLSDEAISRESIYRDRGL